MDAARAADGVRKRKTKTLAASSAAAVIAGHFLG